MAGVGGPSGPSGPTGATGVTGGSCLADGCPLQQLGNASAGPEYGMSGGANDLGVKVVSSGGDIRDCMAQAGGCSLDAVATPQTLQAIWVDANGSTAITVGNTGTILRRSSGIWSTEVSGTMQPLYGVWGANGGPAWAVGGNGVILKRP